MKKIKLSSQLFIALLLILMGIIVYQAFITSRVNSDMLSVRNKQSIGELHTSLANTKTFKRVECAPFSSITIDGGLSTQIIKGEKFEVFYSDAYNIAVTADNGQLKIRKIVNKSNATNSGVIFVFLPEDPQLLTINKSNFGNGSWSIFGFKGTNTQINIDNWNVNLITDMSQLNLHAKNSNVHLEVRAMDSSVVVERMVLSVDADSSSLFLTKEPKIKKLDMDIRLHDSYFNLNPGKEVQVGNVKIQGSVYGEERKDYYRLDNKSTLNVFHCDSLNLSLSCKKDGTHLIKIPESFQANFQNIQCSSNVNIIREDKKQGQ